MATARSESDSSDNDKYNDDVANLCFMENKKEQDKFEFL